MTPGRVAGPGKSTSKWPRQRLADSQLLILDRTKERNSLLWGIWNLIILVPFQSKSKPKYFWILCEMEQHLRRRGTWWLSQAVCLQPWRGLQGGLSSTCLWIVFLSHWQPSSRWPGWAPQAVSQRSAGVLRKELIKRVWSRQGESWAGFQ